ncbi:YbdD/YjiX family protein [Cryobacterium sp. PH31-AA6]|uniref:YbdD/YjiX family protein n=1 Tax=Cryobacterium sp. PH31-AA6 TaxID=3046205 RepID=UPI0024BAC5F5|nr:YbdD/YjiX family protein [Cryobacterium sp. PH31-AA6]MDJ0323313.1 YbdD/YjiX family protein [Cryobacterium sp. PH31-AA6]
MNTVGLLKKGARDLAWFIKGVMGEDAYDKYRAHHESRHACDAGETPPVMTEREFWRDQTDRQDTNPQGRCC